MFQLISRIINGINFASYELDTLTYRAENIKQRQQIMIPGIPKSKVVRVDLLGELDFPLLVTGIDADVVSDDEKELSEKNSQNNSTPPFCLWVSVINRKTDKIVKKLQFFITSYPNYTNEIILDPLFIYEIKSSQAINLITFTGEPVHLRENIVFLNGVVK